MNKGDLQTFYPNHAGSGLNELGFFMQGGLFESSFDPNDDPDLNDENDDQDNTEPENEEAELGESIPEVQLPCFREEVRAKKKELKAQFGKGHISIMECGIEPFRSNPFKYDPIVRIGEQRTCVGWEAPCVNWKSALGQKVCVGWGPSSCVNWKTVIEGNTAAYDNTTTRFEADKAAWDACRKENKGIWVPGWRREWRKFKKAGGLKEIKQRSVRCILGSPLGDKPINTPPPPPPPTDSGLNCSQLEQKYGIVPGKDWGTAPAEIKAEWQNKTCKGSAPTVVAKKTGVYTTGMTCKEMMTEFGIIPGKSFGNAPVEAINEWRRLACTGNESTQQGRGDGDGSGQIIDDSAERNKKMIIIGVIAVVVIILFALVVRAVRS